MFCEHHTSLCYAVAISLSENFVIFPVNCKFPKCYLKAGVHHIKCKIFLKPFEFIFGLILLMFIIGYTKTYNMTKLFILM